MGGLLREAARMSWPDRRESPELRAAHERTRLRKRAERLGKLRGKHPRVRWWNGVQRDEGAAFVRIDPNFVECSFCGSALGFRDGGILQHNSDGTHTFHPRAEWRTQEPCTCGVAFGTAEGPCVCEPSDS